MYNAADRRLFESMRPQVLHVPPDIVIKVQASKTRIHKTRAKAYGDHSSRSDISTVLVLSHVGGEPDSYMPGLPNVFSIPMSHS